MSPESILVKEMCDSRADILHLERQLIDNRNETWYCVLKSRSRPVYLKLQGGKRYSISIRNESKVLEALNEAEILTPRLLAHGHDKESGRFYVVVEEIPGITLHKVISKVESSTIRQIFNQIASWLQTFQEKNELLLSLNQQNYVGLYRKDFNPVEESLKLLSKTSKCLSTRLYARLRSVLDNNVKENWSSVPTEVVHGSLTTFNLLVSTGNCSLAGVLDFEATRQGNLMLDVATLALYLLMSSRPLTAQFWTSVCSEKFNLARIQTEAIPFLIFIYLMRLRAKQANQAVVLPEEELFDSFFKVGRA